MNKLKIIGIVFLIFIVLGIIGSISNPNSKKLDVKKSLEEGYKKGEEVLSKEKKIEPTKKKAEPTLTNTEKHDALYKEWHKYCNFEIEDAVCVCVWEKLFDQYTIDDMREIITDENNSMTDRKIIVNIFNECR